MTYLDVNEVDQISAIMCALNDSQESGHDNVLSFEVTIVDIDGDCVGYIKKHRDDPDGFYGYFPKE